MPGEISDLEPLATPLTILVGYDPSDPVDLINAIDEAAHRGDLNGEQAVKAANFITDLFSRGDPQEDIAQLPRGISDDGRLNVRLEFAKARR